MSNYLIQYQKKNFKTQLYKLGRSSTYMAYLLRRKIFGAFHRLKTNTMLCSIIFLVILSESLAYNILSLLPVKARSHNIFACAILDELAQSGHNVTVFTVFPRKKNSTYYREIDIDRCIPSPTDYFNIDNLIDISVYQGMHTIAEALIPQVEHLRTCTPLQELLDSTHQFDVLITQPFGSDLFAAFSYKLNLPLINVFSFLPFPHLLERMGSISNPSVVPSQYLGTNDMNFFDRVQNLYHYFVFMWFWYFPKQDRNVLQEWLGSSVPPLEDLTKHTSLIFTNTYFSYTPAIPLAPGIVEVGGIHIKNASILPRSIEKFIDESPHGVIYFSMGSFLQSKAFTEEKRVAFLYAFSSCQQRVLWKWENDSLLGGSNNIMISKWMPQRDILAHPKVKLFISHGGLLGTSEAIYEGVPILGIPIFADQRNNLNVIQANGAGEILNYQDISNETVLETIRRLVNVPMYKENMEKMSRIYKDRLLSPTNAAVFWTEYVIRNKGAHHLKTAAAYMPWYQYFLLDVIATVLSTCFVALLIFYYGVKIGFRIICTSVNARSKIKCN